MISRIHFMWGIFCQKEKNYAPKYLLLIVALFISRFALYRLYENATFSWRIHSPLEMDEAVQLTTSTVSVHNRKMIILEFEPCGQTTKTRCFHWMVSSWSASLSNVVSFTRLCMMRSTYCWSFQATFNIFLGVFNDGHSSFPSPNSFHQYCQKHSNSSEHTITI